MLHGVYEEVSQSECSVTVELVPNPIAKTQWGGRAASLQRPPLSTLNILNSLGWRYYML
jgi:hypothetical protein